MPASPTAAQAEASRANGRQSRGPVSEAGKANSRQNGTKHGLCGAACVPACPDEAAYLDAIRRDLAHRWQPDSAAEHHWLDHLALAHLRQRRLDDLEMRVLDRFGTNEPEGDEVGPKLPSLATLIRYRRRIERDMDEAKRELCELIEARDTNEPESEDDAFMETWLGPPSPPCDGQGDPPCAPEAPALNRHERRRLAALIRAA